MQKVSWKLLIRLLTSRRHISGLDLLYGFGVDRYGGNPGIIRCIAFCFYRLVLHGICLKNYICVTVLSNTMKIK